MQATPSPRTTPEPAAAMDSNNDTIGWNDRLGSSLDGNAAKLAIVRTALLLCGAAGNIRSPPVDGMTMDRGLYRIEVTGLARLARLAGLATLRRLGRDLSGRPATAPATTSMPGFVGLLAILMAGLGAGQPQLISVHE